MLGQATCLGRYGRENATALKSGGLRAIRSEGGADGQEFLLSTDPGLTCGAVPTVDGTMSRFSGLNE